MDWDWNKSTHREGVPGVPTVQSLRALLGGHPAERSICFSSATGSGGGKKNEHSMSLLNLTGLSEAHFPNFGLRTVEYAGFLIKALAKKEFPEGLIATQSEGRRAVAMDAATLSNLVDSTEGDVRRRRHLDRCELVAEAMARVGWECLAELRAPVFIPLTEREVSSEFQGLAIHFDSADFVSATVRRVPGGNHLTIDDFVPFGWSSELTSPSWTWVTGDTPSFTDRDLREPRSEQTTFLALPGFYESAGAACVAAVNFHHNRAPSGLFCDRSLLGSFDAPSLTDPKFSWCPDLGHYIAFNYRAYLILKTQHFARRYRSQGSRWGHCVALTIPVTLSSIRTEHDVYAIFVTLAIANARNEQVKRVIERLSLFVGELQVSALRYLGNEAMEDLRRANRKIQKSHAELEVLNSELSKQAAMLRHLAMPLERLTDALRTSQEVSQMLHTVLHAPHTSIFRAAPQVIRYFEENESLEVGGMEFKSFHNGGSYEEPIHLVGVVCQVLLHCFGKAPDKPIRSIDKLLTDTKDLMFNEIGGHDSPTVAQLRDVLGTITTLSSDDFAPEMIEAIKRSEASMASFEMAFENLKRCLHTPYKDFSGKHPLLPLVVVLRDFSKHFVSGGQVRGEDASGVAIGVTINAKSLSSCDQSDLPFRVPTVKYQYFLQFIGQLLHFVTGGADGNYEGPSAIKIQEIEIGPKLFAIKFSRPVTKIESNRSKIFNEMEKWARGAAGAFAPIAGDLMSPFLHLAHFAYLTQRVGNRQRLAVGRGMHRRFLFLDDDGREQSALHINDGEIALSFAAQ